MRYDGRQVLEIILDELAQVLRLPPDAVDRCRRLIEEWLRPQPRVLFLATGDRPPPGATIESFRTLTALGVEANLLRSYSFAQVWSPQDLRARLGAVTLLDEPGPREVAGLPDRFPLLCLLTVSDNTVAKTVLGLRDAVAPQVLRVFLERGRPVVAAGLPPQRMAMEESAGVFWGLPLAVRQWLFEGYRTLEQWGVEFVEPERMARAVRRHLFESDAPSSGVPAAPSPAESAATEARQFLTRDDVLAAVRRGEREMRVAPNTSVTDEAREFARRWGILLLE